MFEEENKKKPTMINRATGSSGGFLSKLSNKLGFQEQAPQAQTPISKREIFKKEAEVDARNSKIQNSFIGKLGTVLGEIGGAGINLVSNIIKNPEKVAQGFTREALSTGISAGEAITKKKGYSFTPHTGFEKKLLGDTPIEGLSKEVGSIYTDAAGDLEEITGKKKGSISNSSFFKNGVMPFFIGATVLSDAFSGGSKKGALDGVFKKEADNLITKVVEDSNPDTVYNTLREHGIDHTVANEASVRLANLTDTKEVRKGMEEVASQQMQVVSTRAKERLDELNAKATGESTISGKKSYSDPIPLSAKELEEQMFLKKNLNKPQELMVAHVDNTPRREIEAPKEYNNVSSRNIDELTSGTEGAPDRSAINAYKEKILNGNTVDPLIITRAEDGKFFVEDGKHRLQAYKELDYTDVPVVYKEAKTNGQKYFHYTSSENAKKINEEGFKIPKKTLYDRIAPKMEGNGVYLLNKDDSGIGKSFGDTKIEVSLNSDTKILNLDKNTPEFLKGINHNKWDSIIKNNGYDGVTKGGQTTIYNTDKILNGDKQIFKNSSGEIDQIINEDGKIIYDKNGDGNLKLGDTGPVTLKKAKEYNSMREKISEVWTSIREKAQDRWTRVEKALKGEKGINIENNPYITETLYHGRLSTKLEDIKSEARDILEGINKDSKTLNVEPQTFTDEVNDYLIAKHAPERNAKLGDGAAGMTDSEAQAIMDRVEVSPNRVKIKEYANKITDINKQTLDILYADGKPWGLITKETYDNLRATYKNHVPLNRIMEDVTDSDVGQIISGSGIDVRGSGIKRAKGSDKKVADIMTNVFTNVAQATTRIEKNLINYDLYKFVQENPKNGWVTIKSRTPIGKDFEGNIIFKPENGNNILQMVVDGKTKYLEFKDPHMAEIIRGVNIQHLPSSLNFIGSYSRLLSNLATRFNPEFWLTNKFRDVQDALIFASSQGRLKVNKQIGKQLRLEGEHAVLDYLRGKDTPDARMYKQMLTEGGTTGGMALSTRKQLEFDFEKIKKIAKSKPRQAFEAITNKIDQTNEVFENSTRFIVYKQAIENGATAREAAYLAKESTVNFNRKGTAGPVINAMYMFANASIQGMTKSFKSLKDPKTLLATVGTITAATYAVNEYNESIDPEWRNKVSPFEKSGGLTILLPELNSDGEHNRIVIPLAYSIRFIKSSAEAAYDATNGDGKNFSEAMEEVFASIADGYNPLGGNDIGSTITPTIADLPRELAVNKKWSGSKVRPDFNQNLPESRQYWDSLKDTDMGKMFIGGSKMLSDKLGIEISPEDANYVLEQLTGGAGGFVKKVANVSSKVAQGEEVKGSEIPFVSRFLKQGDPEALEKFGNRQDKGDLSDVKSEQAKISFDREQKAKDIIEEIEGKPKDFIRERLLVVAKEDKALTEEIVSQVKEKGKGFTTEDKQIRSLDIKNGGRAKYIEKKLQRLKTSEEKKAFLLNLAEKKLITAEVLQQIVQLRGKEQ